MCFKFISYNLKTAAKGHFNIFLPLLSFHFKHENLRRELKDFFFPAKHPGLHMLPRVIPSLVFLARWEKAFAEWRRILGAPRVKGIRSLLASVPGQLSHPLVKPLIQEKCGIVLPSAVPPTHTPYISLQYLKFLALQQKVVSIKSSF